MSPNKDHAPASWEINPTGLGTVPNFMKKLIITIFMIQLSIHACADVSILSPGQSTPDGKYICGATSSGTTGARMQCAVNSDFCGMIKRAEADHSQWAVVGCASEFGHLTTSGAYQEALSIAARSAPGCDIVRIKN